jgi:curved DNA-binding protein CbpA
MSKDYYRILGVLDDAEDIVIRAAYKALAQRYHPDKWTGNKDEANKRMSEINEAYGVLSDPIQRKQYDATRGKSEYEDINDDDEDEMLSSIESDWKEVVEYFPDLKKISDNLSKISKQLDFTFKTILLEKKEFNKRVELSRTLETFYLQKYFGKNPKIIAFAKQLILDGKKEDAKKLNRAVELLGSDVDPEIIIKKITGNPDFVYKNKSNSGSNSWKYGDNNELITVRDLARKFIATKDLFDALELLKLKGGIATPMKVLSGLFEENFTKTVYKVTYKDTIKVNLTRPEFIRFMIKIAEEILAS